MKKIIMTLIILAVLGLAGYLFYQEFLAAPKRTIPTTSTIQATLTTLSSGVHDNQLVVKDTMKVGDGDVIETLETGRATITYVHALTLDHNSKMTLGLRSDKNSVFDVTKGNVWARLETLGNDELFEIDTGNAQITAKEGASFGVYYSQEGETKVVVSNGVVQARSRLTRQIVSLQAGLSAVIESNGILNILKTDSHDYDEWYAYNNPGAVVSAPQETETSAEPVVVVQSGVPDTIPSPLDTPTIPLASRSKTITISSVAPTKLIEGDLRNLVYIRGSGLKTTKRVLFNSVEIKDFNIINDGEIEVFVENKLKKGDYSVTAIDGDGGERVAPVNVMVGSSV